MTREEAIKQLQIRVELIENAVNGYPVEDYKEALKMAISALEHTWRGKAIEMKPCADAISRDAVDKYIARLLSGYLYDGERERLEIFSAYLWELPSVTQKSGKWKREEFPNFTVAWFCNKCGRGSYREFNFCPNCGAKMESEG